ncbi:hypothetical protein [Candidatus Symbiopectobacterium sp. PLON1]|uniref:hypothetical protein n=1 Tax=Candidatus Symbiopectobacterium sp. PLON1 TaxID=2794575 RepID=UPI001A2457DA|nr:hypothetical protein [Candidatus Symbiopectobacterium sp. PLON1]MBG6246827.1 hypothetical protein [Candidatus Symbiopectobacterium sp. PLON1]
MPQLLWPVLPSLRNNKGDHAPAHPHAFNVTTEIQLLHFTRSFLTAKRSDSSPPPPPPPPPPTMLLLA